jgi:hypothetical protein
MNMVWAWCQHGICMVSVLYQHGMSMVWAWYKNGMSIACVSYYYWDIEMVILSILYIWIWVCFLSGIMMTFVFDRSERLSYDIILTFVSHYLTRVVLAERPCDASWPLYRECSYPAASPACGRSFAPVQWGTIPGCAVRRATSPLVLPCWSSCRTGSTAGYSGPSSYPRASECRDTVVATFLQGNSIVRAWSVHCRNVVITR